MPLYEYRCEEDGETITVLRSMDDADKPVEDPKGLGRTFVRAHSTFAVGAAKAEPPSPGCACGNPYGPCNQ
ncbi:MAG: FmdB family zinc ribbon protein [Planctomycetota bacterium]|jgi:putative FmdB family regulatory protein